MARNLRQVIEAHLGQVTLDSIEKVVQIEQQAEQIVALEAKVRALEPTPIPTETPDGQ